MVLGGLVLVVVGILVVNYFKGLDETTLPGVNTQTDKATVQENGETYHTVQKGETLWSISEKYYEVNFFLDDNIKLKFWEDCDEKC